jgi:hypothetical protein
LSSAKDTIQKMDDAQTKKVPRFRDYLRGSFLIGLILFIVIYITLWMIWNLDYLILNPIELLIQGQHAVIILLGYTLVVKFAMI